MAVTPFQSGILRSLADQRRRRGESYVAGGVALNELLAAPRRSRDIDLFHDSETALAATWEADGEALRGLGYTLEVIRLAPSFVEALVARGTDRSLMQWVRHSAFRFFPLIEDELLGLALHPFDLATNKVLAMAGRLEPRDWIDVLTRDAKLQPLGFLVWAACGKDPGYNPVSLLGEMSRSHYSQAELDTLDFEGTPPVAATLSIHWHEALRSARAVCGALPPGHLGTCVVTTDGQLFRGKASDIGEAFESGRLGFHAGRIGGAWPSFR
ncbi:MAG: hypothetical protein IPK07_21140 [Deltaproteobacteria bacterium]|nr:hypothetical protein [Deltaproteobacteria bacterium]